jgi:hypothetical protein
LQLPASAKKSRREKFKEEPMTADTPPILGHSLNPAVWPVRDAGRDRPVSGTTAYGNGPQDFVTDTSETAAITHHQISLDGKKIHYTAAASHLVTVDPESSKPDAKFFYVAFTADGMDLMTRPVTLFL